MLNGMPFVLISTAMREMAFLYKRNAELLQEKRRVATRETPSC